MAKAEVLQLFHDLSRNLGDPLIFEYYYTHTLLDLARSGQFTEAAILTSQTGQESYRIPDEAVDTLAVFYADLDLARTARQSLEDVNLAWRDERGVPAAYTLEDEQDRTFRLYPAAAIAAEDFIFMFGSPLGRDFPPNGVGMIYTVLRTDCQDFFDQVLAFAILAAEFSRDSQHRDDTFAKVCREWATTILKYIGGQ